MKRRELLRHLQSHGCLPLREGGSHSIWVNPQIDPVMITQARMIEQAFE